MEPIAWGVAAVLAAATVVAFAQIVDLRRRLDNVPLGDDDLLGLVHRIDNELGMVESAVRDVGSRVASLEASFPRALQRSAVVVYDGYPGMVGSLSRSVAMLDLNGDGWVLSVLVNRDESRFFLKAVQNGQGVEPLSPEENTAIRQALHR
jgi:hypothetical protein